MMNEKGPTGPDLGSKEEKSPEQIEATRRKYLEALAISLGANETTVLMSVDALLRNAGDLASIDYGKDKNNRNDLDPKDVEQIEALGSWLLTGSSQRDQLKFAVGSTLLSLLIEDQNSSYFENLDQWVGMWTDGTGDKKFKEMVAEEK